MLASLACAIHCSVLPVALAMGSLSGLVWLENPVVEVFFLIAAYLFAGWSIVPRYFRQRTQHLPIVLMCAGLLLLTIGMFNHVHDGHIRLLSVSGGLALIAAHYFNYRILHQR